MDGGHTEIRTIQTPHYSFDLKITKELYPVHKVLLLIGDPMNACIEANILMADIDERMKALGMHTLVRLNKINALIECSNEDITTNYMEKYSMGQEMLRFLLNYIKTNYKHVTRIALNDTSYIPCSIQQTSTLDLLSYSIAKYGKTWYEMKFNAYSKNNMAYMSDINKYMSKDTKRANTFESILDYIIPNNDYALKFIYTDIDNFRALYHNSETLPQFFTSLTNHIPKEDRCRFFKSWLELFINHHVKYDREWFIDIAQQGGKHKRLQHRRTYKRHRK
jgi:hypothetical protein